MALTDNLVSYWKLDESSGNATDSVGSMALVNTDVTYDTGKINNGAVFNATTDRLKSSTGDAAIFDFERTDPFSFSFWVKPTSLADNQVILSRQKSAANYTGWGFNVNAAGNGIFVLANNADGSNLIYVTMGNGTFVNGTWCHVTVTYDGSSNASGVKIYKNGLSVSLGTTFNNLTSSTKQTLELQIGNRDVSNYGASGVIDEVSVWNRTLTPTEVTSLYNSGNGLTYPFTASYELLADVANFALTGNSITASIGYILNLGVGEFLLTGLDVLGKLSGWREQSKNSTIWTERTKNSASFTEQTKNVSTWNEQTKN